MRALPRFFRISASWIACGLIFAYSNSTTLAQTSGMPPIPGNPIIDLQEQINALEQRVSEIEGATALQDFLVDCADGQKIADVLAQVAHTTRPVTITIKGTCQESLTINRDNVTIRGSNPGDGLAPGTEWFILNLTASRGTRIENLSLTGGGTALNAASGATFEAGGLKINGANNGVHLSAEASGTLWNSNIEDCDRGVVAWGSGTLYVHGGEIKNSGTFGVSAAGKSYISLNGGLKVTGSGAQAVFAGGGSIEVQNTTVEDNNSVGVWAMGGGSINIHGSNTYIRKNNGGVVAWAATVGIRDQVQVIENNENGITSTFGGNVDLQDGVLVKQNTGAGISVNGNSSAQVSGIFIENNTYDGIQLSDTSAIVFQGPPNVISNNGFWGINCNQTPPSVAQIWGNPGTVSGNIYGEISCPGYP